MHTYQNMLLKTITTSLLLLSLLPALQAKTYAVIVGVEKYDGTVPNLTAAVDDAQRVYNFLVKKNDSANIILLKDFQATKQNIIRAMEVFKKAAPGDFIVFYFSGHGAPDLFCPTNVNAGQMALWHSDIKKAFRASVARSKLCIADACYSGSIKTSTRPTTRPASVAEKGNIIVFMSSKKNETSIESKYYNTGLFTNFLLTGLSGQADENKNRKVTAYELYVYVRAKVKAASKNTQTPVMQGRFDKELVLSTY